MYRRRRRFALCLSPFCAKKESTDAFIKDVFPKHVENLERVLVDGGGHYFSGSSRLSVADVAVYDAMVFSGTKLIAGIPDVENPCVDPP